MLHCFPFLTEKNYGFDLDVISQNEIVKIVTHFGRPILFYFIQSSEPLYTYYSKPDRYI